MATLVPSDVGPLHLFVVRREGQVTGLAPMQIKRRGAALVLEHLATYEIYEPTDLLYESEADALALLRCMLRYRLPFVLGRLPHDSCIPSLLPSLVRPPAWARTLPMHRYPAVDLRLYPEGELNSGRRSDLRRMRRKASERGVWRHEVLQPAPQHVSALLDKAIDIEAHSWKVETGRALRQNLVVQTFLRDYLPREAAAGSLRLAFAYSGEQAVAMQIAIACGEGYWLLKIGYDARLASVAPGQLLMQDTMRYSVDQHLQTYELMGVTADWIRMWTTQEHASWRVEVFPTGWNSWLHLISLAVARTIRRLRRRLRGRHSAR